MRGPTFLLIAIALCLPTALAVYNNDAGTGRDAGDPWSISLGLGVYTGGIAGPLGDTRDPYDLFQSAGHGIGFELAIPPADVPSSSVWVSETICGNECTGYIEPDGAGVYRWQGGTQWGYVSFDLQTFYGEYDYTFRSFDVDMPDLVAEQVRIAEPADDGSRVVSATFANRGSAPAPAVDAVLTARHLTTHPGGPVELPRIESTREIAVLAIPMLMPGELVELSATWMTHGEAGYVRVEANALIQDALWRNNVAEAAVDLGPASLPMPDPLNTRVSRSVSATWVIAGTSSPNGDPGLMAGAYLGSYYDHEFHLVSAEMGTSLEGEPRAEICVLAQCDRLV